MSQPFQKRNFQTRNRNSTFPSSDSSHIQQVPLQYSIEIVFEPHDVDEAVRKIREKCSTFPVIGLDCEWTPVKKKKEKVDVALLQIATDDGSCILFRTCFMNELGKPLLDLLSDVNIIKVGVGISSDVKFLKEKFKKVNVRSTFDLRFLTRLCNIFTEKESLNGLTKTILNFELQKDNILEYDWQIKTLKMDWIHYAALDALVAVKIFEKLLHLFHEQQCDEPFSRFLPATLVSQYFTLPDSPCREFLEQKL